MISLDALPISERFVRASGPGGQNVNKVATAVELRLDVPSAPLPEYVKARLAVLAGTRMTTEGILVIDSREYRTQIQNREAARARLKALLDEAAVRPKVRRKTKPTKAAKARRTTEKVQRSEIKQRRRRILSDD
jgi:ribosome-associated protein